MAFGVQGQHKGVQTSQPTAEEHGLHKSITNASQTASSPSHEQIRISYGEIVAVDPEKNRVQVAVIGNSAQKKEGELLANGFFFPLSQPLSVIHGLFGSLRKGLCVRIYWRGGQHAPGSESVLEVISDNKNELKSGVKAPQSNTAETQVFKMMSGGLAG